MPEVRDTPAVGPIDPHVIFELASLDEDQLDERIWRDLSSEQYSPFLLDLLMFVIFDLSNNTSIKAESDLAKDYKTWRKRILGTPGRFVVPYIQFLAGGGHNVRSFCKKVDFCRNRARIQKILKDFKDELALATATATGGAFLAVADTEVFKEMVAGANDLKSLVTDVLFAKAIPASLLFKIFIYSLEEICPCCKACEGKGKMGDKDCAACSGDGIQEPFPFTLL